MVLRMGLGKTKTDPRAKEYHWTTRVLIATLQRGDPRRTVIVDAGVKTSTGARARFPRITRGSWRWMWRTVVLLYI